MASTITNLAKDTKTTAVLHYFAAGTTTRTSTIIDMSDFDGVLFVLHLGTVTDGSVILMTIKENTANSTSSPTPISPTGLTAGVTGATSSNTLLIADIYRPLLRYVFAVVTITTQNCEILGITAHQYGARIIPVTQDATTVVVAPTLLTGI